MNTTTTSNSTTKEQKNVVGLDDMVTAMFHRDLRNFISKALSSCGSNDNVMDDSRLDPVACLGCTCGPQQKDLADKQGDYILSDETSIDRTASNTVVSDLESIAEEDRDDTKQTDYHANHVQPKKSEGYKKGSLLAKLKMSKSKKGKSKSRNNPTNASGKGGMFRRFRKSSDKQ